MHAHTNRERTDFPPKEQTHAKELKQSRWPWLRAGVSGPAFRLEWDVGSDAEYGGDAAEAAQHVAAAACAVCGGAAGGGERALAAAFKPWARVFGEGVRRGGADARARARGWRDAAANGRA
eukprot:2576390-Pleurochrysis_carterae.AAC.1